MPIEFDPKIGTFVVRPDMPVARPSTAQEMPTEVYEDVIKKQLPKGK